MKIKNCSLHKKLTNKKINRYEKLAEKIQPNLDLFLRNYDNSEDDNKDEEIKADFKQRKSKRLIELRKKNKKPYQFNLHGKTKTKKKSF